jgi:uncharacterized membrane protein
MNSPNARDRAVSETQTEKVSERLLFIDFVRGIVMILMAWDHVSGFWNPGKMGSEGLRGYFPVFIDFNQFMLRFITHVCAPTFMFLAGTSLALSVRRRQARGESERDISKRLVARGTMMWLFAIYIVGPAFGSGPLYFGVLACFGLSFILWSVLRKLPTPVILAASVIMILFHPSLNLDFIPDSGLAFYLKAIIHEPASMRAQWPLGGLYPIIPWIGVIGLGWGFGDFLHSYDKTKIQSLKLPLVATGFGAWVLFVAVRWFNGFGVLVSRQGSTLMDWLSVAKYPPSLAFLLVTLGEMCFFLAIGLLVQRLRNPEKGLTGMVLLFGRIPLFFYLSHLVLYRLRPFFMTMTRPRELFFSLTLWETGAFWVIGLAILWWLGGHYYEFKRRHKDSLLQYI